MPDLKGLIGRTGITLLTPLLARYLPPEVTIVAVRVALVAASDGTRVTVSLRLDGPVHARRRTILTVPSSPLHARNVKGAATTGENPEVSGDYLVWVEAHAGTGDWQGREVEFVFHWSAFKDPRTFDALLIPDHTPSLLNQSRYLEPRRLPPVTVLDRTSATDTSARQLWVEAPHIGAIYVAVARNAFLVEGTAPFVLHASPRILDASDQWLSRAVQRVGDALYDLTSLFSFPATDRWALATRSEVRGLRTSHNGMVVGLDPSPSDVDTEPDFAYITMNAASAHWGAGLRISGDGSEALRSAICIAIGIYLEQTRGVGSVNRHVASLRARASSSALRNWIRRAQGLPAPRAWATQALVLLERMKSASFRRTLRDVTTRYWGYEVPTSVIRAELDMEAH